MPTRIAIYARVSTVNRGQDITLQTRELRQFAEARGWQLVGEYIDAGVSGAKDSRPELNRLMADAHKRRFDVVCVWKFDRFARSVSHLLRALETFKALSIDFVSYSEQMDTSTSAGKMVFTCTPVSAAWRLHSGVEFAHDADHLSQTQTQLPQLFQIPQSATGQVRLHVLGGW